MMDLGTIVMDELDERISVSTAMKTNPTFWYMQLIFRFECPDCKQSADCDAPYKAENVAYAHDYDGCTRGSRVARTWATSGSPVEYHDDWFTAIGQDMEAFLEDELRFGPQT